MARTYSIDIDLGTKAPEFELRDSVTNNLVNLYDIKGEKGIQQKRRQRQRHHAQQHQQHDWNAEVALHKD